MSWVIRFVALACAAMCGLLALLWAASGFEALGVEGHARIALILGVLFTTALAAVLMGLVFHSARTRKDDDI